MTKLIGLALFAAACGTTTKPATDPPPTWGVPITGGTILATKDNQRVVVADPDRDRLMVVQLATGATIEIPLQKGDEPGRLIEDAAGRIHVALRRGGAVVTLQGTDVVARRAVCAEPRGLAYDAAADSIDVACATGELVTLPAAGGDATRSVFVDRDLRDVLIVNNALYVTRFKTAELLALDATGAITSRTAMPTVQRFDESGEGGAQPPSPVDGGVGSGDTTGLINSIPAVAWRAVALADGRIAVVHQRAAQRELSVVHGGYGGIGCGSSPVESTITLVTPPNGTTPATTLATAPLNGALPVDLAVSSSGQLAVALAGGKTITTAFASSLVADSQQGCQQNGQGSGDDLGAPTSVAFDGIGDLIAYYPEVPALVVTQNGAKRTITLPGDLGYDSGRNMFHEQTPSGLACASCHPEGRDDGLVWKFAELGPRRTQVLAGSILSRAPYHWTGDQADLPTLMDDVFAVRMAGTQPTNSEHRSLGPFLERIPAPAPIGLANADAAARGKAIFESEDTTCLSCHVGPLMSTKQIVDVGTGGAFKVPSLVGVGARAPFLHDGCATTLMDRFTTCGGGDHHGKTSQLSAAQLTDLVAYLETL
jgi:hypothetical protein